MRRGRANSNRPETARPPGPCPRPRAPSQTSSVPAGRVCLASVQAFAVLPRLALGSSRARAGRPRIAAASRAEHEFLIGLLAASGWGDGLREEPLRATRGLVLEWCSATKDREMPLRKLMQDGPAKADELF